MVIFRYIQILICLLVFTPEGRADFYNNYREWTNSSGKVITARIVYLEGDSLTIERQVDHKKFKLSLHDLRDKDVDFVQSYKSIIPVPLDEFEEDIIYEKWFSNKSKLDNWESYYYQLLFSLREHWLDRSPFRKFITPLFTENFIFSEWVKLYFVTDIKSWGEDWVEEFIHLSQVTNIRSLFIQNLSLNDDANRALKILLEIAKEYPKEIEEYPALAVAIAIVHDQPFPAHWPHHQVPQLALSSEGLSVSELFNLYVRLEKERVLEYSLLDLKVEELKFIVDHRLSKEEVYWVDKNVPFRKRKFDEVFNWIQYDYGRIHSQQYNWPYNRYLLEDIRATGGICVDQAYFGAMAGKAKGIPTLVFTGQGMDGGHAWFGYLERHAKWNLDVGRYESQNYPVGRALDPQTWTEINDTQLKALAKGLSNNRDYIHAKILFLWAVTNFKEEYCVKILQQSRNAYKQFIPAWKLEAAMLEKYQVPIPQQEKFWVEWASAFEKNADLRVVGQQRLMTLYEKSGQPMRVENLRKKMILQNRRERFDLGIGVAAIVLAEAVEEENWENAEKEFNKLLRKFDDKGGGELFYKLVQPYVLACVEAGQLELAMKTLERTVKKMKIQSGTLLANAVLELESTIFQRAQNH